MRRALCLVWMVAASAAAQQNAPHAAFVYPAGGQRGATFEITVGGEFLDGACAAIFTGEGVRAEVTSFTKPLAQKDLDELERQLKELNQNKAHPAATTNGDKTQNAAGPPPANQAEAADEKRLAADLRRQIEQTKRMRAAPALSQSVTLRVSIDSSAASGNHELRLLTDHGLTNPLVFLVDRLPETTRSFQFVPLALAAGGGLPLSAQARAEESTPPQAIQPPTILNGQAMPGGVDRYRFHARKGQKIVIAAMTRTLIPYMADTVPGWFQAALTLTDSSGKELAYADHFGFEQEPAIEQEIPADGEYMLTVRDLLNRGREDFIYRIAIGEIPFVTGVFPLGARAGSRTQFALTGWNLTSSKFHPDVSAPGIYPLFKDDLGWHAGSLAYAVGELPERVELQPASDAAHARRVELPQIVDGVIEQPGVTAYFRIDADAGDEIVAEVEARRLGSPLDSTLTLTDAHGKQLAFNDDFEDKGVALLTHQADSKISYRFSVKGVYYLKLTDSQQQGGPGYAYRLRISHPRPDFDVRIAPSSVNLRPGRTTPVSVLLLRRDGFADEVRLHIKDGPPGLVLSGGAIPTGADSVRIGLTAPADAIAAPHKLVLEAEATIDGRIVRHEVTPADDQMQAFAWRQFVPAQQGLLWIVGKEHRKSPWAIADAVLTLPAGASAFYRIAIPPALGNQEMHLRLDDPPPGITITNIVQAGQWLQASISADAKVKPGLAGNLIVELQAAKKTTSNATNANAAKPTPIDYLPAIPFRIIR